jgi:integrase
VSGAKKRIYGTGSLQLVGKSWFGLWRDDDGQRVKKRVGTVKTPATPDGLTRTQAEAALRKLRMETADPVVEHATHVTVELAGEALKARLKIKERKKSHQMTVAGDLRNHLAPFFGAKPLAKITPEDVERYIRRKQKTLAIKTVRNHVNTLHSIFDIGIRKGWCLSNPVKLADRPQLRRTETRIRFLSQSQLDRLIAGAFPEDARGSDERPLYLTAAMTGLRQGELLGLRWRDVDFNARRVRVVSPYVRGEFADPKSEGSGRSVPMATLVAKELAELRLRSFYSADEELVFAHPETGNPMDRSKLTRRFAAALERAGLPKVTFHELRHTFGTRMAAAGVPIRTIQHWMGHADMKTTQIYAHYSPTDSEADTVDAAFG